MRRFGNSMLCGMVAIAVVTAPVLCACPSLMAAVQPQDESSCSKCCESDPPVTDSPPCEQCNLKAPHDQMTPQRLTIDCSSNPAFGVPLMIVTFVSPTPARIRDVEPWATPPLLQDLFHSFSLLLN